MSLDVLAQWTWHKWRLRMATLHVALRPVFSVACRPLTKLLSLLVESACRRSMVIWMVGGWQGGTSVDAMWQPDNDRTTSYSAILSFCGTALYPALSLHTLWLKYFLCFYLFSVPSFALIFVAGKVRRTLPSGHPLWRTPSSSCHLSENADKKTRSWGPWICHRLQQRGMKSMKSTNVCDGFSQTKTFVSTSPWRIGIL